MVYLAAAITAAGFAVLAGTNWEHISSPVRVLIPATAAAVLLGAGEALRRTQSGPLERAASLAWLLGGALLGVTAAISAREAGYSENNIVLAAAISAIVSAVVLWALMPMHPQVVGIGAATLLLSIAFGVRAPEDWSQATIGVALAVVGLGELVLIERGVLVPRSSARLIGGAGIAFGGFFAGLTPSPPALEMLSFAAVIVLMLAGIRFQSLAYVAFAVLTTFAGLLQLILRHIHSPTLAGLALIAIGMLVLLAIATLGKTQPWARRRPAAREIDDG